MGNKNRYVGPADTHWMSIKYDNVFGIAENQNIEFVAAACVYHGVCDLILFTVVNAIEMGSIYLSIQWLWGERQFTKWLPETKRQATKIATCKRQSQPYRTENEHKIWKNKPSFAFTMGGWPSFTGHFYIFRLFIKSKSVRFPKSFIFHSHFKNVRPTNWARIFVSQEQYVCGDKFR